MANPRDYQSLGADVADLDQAAFDRLVDAEAMFTSGRHAATIAMGVYCLEITLKARICRRLDLPKLPRPFEIHDLDGLLTLSGLTARLNAAAVGVCYNWLEILKIAPKLNGLRYLPDSNWTVQEAQDFLDQLRTPPEGILIWLSTQP